MKQEFNSAQTSGGYFAFFDGEKLVILINGFQRKTQKTPKNEIEKALKIMAEYYEQKSKENGN